MAPKRGRSRARATPEPAASDAGSSPDQPESEAPSPPEPDTPNQPGVAQRQQTPEEEEDGEELIGDDMEADYRPMGALDQYEEDGVDDQEYGGMSAAARLAAEAELEARDGREQRSRMPAALQTPDDEDADERPRRRRREEAAPEDSEAAMLDGFLDEDDEDRINLEDYNMPLSQWIQTPAVSEEVKRRFKKFLTHFDPSTSAELTDASTPYHQLIRDMCASNGESLKVSYLHLSHSVPILAIWVADVPALMLELLDAAALEVVRIMFPDYERVRQSIHVRITELPIHDSIRDLRQVHMGCLVKVSGVVTRRSGVFPQLKVCKYNCGSCGYVLGPFSVVETEPRMAGVQCPSCQAKGPYSLNTEQTVYCNFQKVMLQESPGSVPPGRLPRHKEVVLQWDLIDTVRPGEEIEVTGVYNTSFDASLNRSSGFPVFSTVVDANFVQKKEDADLKDLTEEDTREIIRLSKDPQIRNKIVASMAPSICGHDNIKTALALSMFGGKAKDINGKHRIRGDINVLLLGDPGTAKSQFLKYIEKTAPRAVYTTGQGASAVGLTASVHKDPVTREWTLEGGALVLADRGVCLIDEFDKMNESDRTSIHEAMEQQSISISKAGINATLQARCAVIAAANPIKGRYDPSVSFMDNVDLTEPILSRFDCVNVVKDEVDPIKDEQLAEFVVHSHKRSHPQAKEGDSPHDAPEPAAPISQALLKKYILYARKNVSPVLQGIDEGKITQVYAELRRESASGGVSIAVRHIESVIRMAEASARMHLREQVRNDDIDLAISCLIHSVINSQKFAVKRVMERKFSKYLVSVQDTDQLLEFQLRKLFAEASRLHDAVSSGSSELPASVGCEDFEAKAREVSVDDLTPFFGSAAFNDDQYGFARTNDAAGREVIVQKRDLPAFDRATAAAAQRAAAQPPPEAMPQAVPAM